MEDRPCADVHPSMNGVSKTDAGDGKSEGKPVVYAVEGFEVKPMGGWRALPCEERSERLERRLGDGEIIADGLSLGA